MDNLNGLISYVDTETGPREREIKFGIKAAESVIEGGREQNLGSLQHVVEDYTTATMTTRRESTGPRTGENSKKGSPRTSAGEGEWPLTGFGSQEVTGRLVRSRFVWSDGDGSQAEVD